MSDLNLISDDWGKIVQLLPKGWQEQARECGALKFGRQFSSPEYYSGCCSSISVMAAPCVKLLPEPR